MKCLLSTDIAAHVPRHDSPEAAASRGRALLAPRSVRRRLPPAVPQRVSIQPGAYTQTADSFVKITSSTLYLQSQNWAPGLQRLLFITVQRERSRLVSLRLSNL